MLSVTNLHDFAINAVQSIADSSGWPLGYGKLKNEDIELLNSGVFGCLNWKWALDTYGTPSPSNGVLDISIRIAGQNESFPGAIALCHMDSRRKRFEICMVENFKKGQATPLTRRVWLSVLIYAHIFAKAAKLDEIFIMNPTESSKKKYHAFGFYEDCTCPPNMSASIKDIESSIQACMSNLGT